MRDQFAYFGIQTPQRRKAVAALLRLPQPAAKLLNNAGTLWQMHERECQYVAVDLLARHHARLAPGDCAALLHLVQEKPWWDTVDGLAGVIGDVVRAARKHGGEPQVAMDEALRAPSLWVRRVAMLHQLGWRSETDTDRLFGYALALSGETDFFIRKAIGWALRDYARTAPQAVSEFLAGSGRVLSSLSRREAAKYL